jgi:hypothetical protein
MFITSAVANMDLITCKIDSSLHHNNRRNLLGDAGVRFPHFLKDDGQSPHFVEVEKIF